MNIDWSKAPEWASYAAMDENGEWYWFENRPYIADKAWDNTGGNYRAAAIYGWKETLCQRPTSDQPTDQQSEPPDSPALYDPRVEALKALTLLLRGDTAIPINRAIEHLVNDIIENPRV